MEENFKAPSAVKKKPIPPPATFFLFFFLRLRVAFASSVPAPTPGAQSRSSRCCRTRRSGPGSRGRRVTRSLAGGPCQPPGPLLLHQRAADAGTPRRKKFKLGFYFKWGGRSEGTDRVVGKLKNNSNEEENRKWNKEIPKKKKKKNPIRWLLSSSSNETAALISFPAASGTFWSHKLVPLRVDLPGGGWSSARRRVPGSAAAPRHS